MKWKYDPAPLGAAKGVACCDVVNRGVAYWNNSIIFNTLDGRTISVDAQSGARKWETQLGDINRGETITMAPLVVRDKVFVGNSGGEFGVRGWLTALDAASGEQVWRAYSTGPDKDVLLGSQFSPFYEQDRGEDLGVNTWPSEALEDGRRHGLGMAFVRSRSEPPVLRARRTPVRGIRSSAQATTSGRPASSPATQTRERRAGSINGARTTCSTTMASTRTSCWTCR